MVISSANLRLFATSFLCFFPVVFGFNSCLLIISFRAKFDLTIIKLTTFCGVSLLYFTYNIYAPYGHSPGRAAADELIPHGISCSLRLAVSLADLYSKNK